jgi:hypothetical protein
MKTAVLGLTLMLHVLDLRASDQEGLFVPGEETFPKTELRDGEFIQRIKAVRLKVTRAVLRFDTESEKQCWLEIDFDATGAGEIPDPGGFYIFRIDRMDYSGFTTRGHINDSSLRWALGIRADDLDAGRDLLAKIGKVYGLPKGKVLDQTRKAKRGGAKSR